MGNSSSFIRLHGRRLINRYNAQYKALKFLEREKLPSAPHHEIPKTTNKIQNDSRVLRDLQSKDPVLSEYLKEVYVKSHEEHENRARDVKSSARPLPELREPSHGAMFPEPEEVEKGYCTLTQATQFMSDHEDDPLKNSAEAISVRYCLDKKDVENVLRYFTVFDTINTVKEPPPERLLTEELQEAIEKKQILIEKLKEEKVLPDRTEEEEEIYNLTKPQSSQPVNRETVKNQ